MKTLGLPCLCLLLCAACMVRFPGDWGSSTIQIAGLQIEHDDGVFTIDGVELAHHRLITVKHGHDDAADLAFTTATGEIELGPSEAGDYVLTVDLFSEIEGDGEVTVENGRLVARSAGGHKLLINAVRGTVPDGLPVRCESGLGSVRLAGFSGGRDMDIDVGMGDCTVSGCVSARVDIEAGMGSIELTGVTASEVVLDAGMGSTSIAGCSLESLRGDFGMGSVTVANSSIDDVRADVGMGSLHFERCTLGALSADVGMGDVVLEGTPRPATFDVDIGMGGLVQR